MLHPEGSKHIYPKGNIIFKLEGSKQNNQEQSNFHMEKPPQKKTKHICITIYVLQETTPYVNSYCFRCKNQPNFDSSAC